MPPSSEGQNGETISALPDMKSAQQEPPKDVNELVERMKLNEREEEAFRHIFKTATHEYVKITSDNKKEVNRLRNAVKRDRDSKVKQMVDKDQYKIYQSYLRYLNHRKKNRSSSGSDANI
jgi:hypothetical protein